MRRHWWILVAITLGFFFLNAATFTSLGVALYSMSTDLRWSYAAAGFGFTLLGVATGVSSLLPAILIKRIGGRMTVALGMATLAGGFVLTALLQNLWMFYLAMLLLGTGYSLAGNVPGVYLIAGSFPRHSSRMIGAYMMGGAFGAVVGPVIAQSIIGLTGSWRHHWLAMAVIAAVIGVISLICIRDVRTLSKAASRAESRGGSANGWKYRDAVMTPQFLLVAGTMTMTMACVTTLHSVSVSHLTQLGATERFAGLSLAIVGFVSMLAKGAAGPLCDRIPSRIVLASGMTLQMLGIVLYGIAYSPPRIYAATLVYGLGWGLAYVAASVVLLEYFGRELGAQLLGAVWMVATFAAIGPVAAGIIADAAGSFAPIFYIFAVILLFFTLPVAIMQRPAIGAAPVAA